MTVSANDPVLTPRAKDSQLRVAPADEGVCSRMLGSQAKAAIPAETRHPAGGACASGSPGQREQIGKIASASCCQRAPSACPAPKACCAAK
jgi:hypothetical protein